MGDWWGCAQAHYRDYGKMTYARSVFVVHNIAHQGRGPAGGAGPLEVPGRVHALLPPGRPHRRRAHERHEGRAHGRAPHRRRVARVRTAALI